MPVSKRNRAHVKPWDIQVSQACEGGFMIKRPDSCVGSKHDSKLKEATVTVLGEGGWYIKVNQKGRTCEGLHSEPPFCGEPRSQAGTLEVAYEPPDAFGVGGSADVALLSDMSDWRWGLFDAELEPAS